MTSATDVAAAALPTRHASSPLVVVVSSLQAAEPAVTTSRWNQFGVGPLGGGYVHYRNQFHLVRFFCDVF